MHHSNKKSSLFLSLAAAFGVSCVGVSSANAQSPHVHGAASMNMVVDGEQLLVEFEAPLASVVGFEYQPQSRIEKMKLKKAVTALQSANLFEFEGADCELVQANAKTPWSEDKDHQQEHDHHQDRDHDDDHKHDHDDDHKHDHDEDHKHDHDEDHKHDHDDDHKHDHDDDHKHDHDEEHKHEHDEEHNDEHGHDEEHKHDDEHGHDEEHKHDDQHGHDEEHKHDHDEEHGAHHTSETHSDISVIYEFACKGSIESVTVGIFSQFELMENIKVQWISDSGQGAQDLTKQKNSFAF